MAFQACGNVNCQKVLASCLLFFLIHMSWLFKMQWHIILHFVSSYLPVTFTFAIPILTFFSWTCQFIFLLLRCSVISQSLLLYVN
jgi:hypothetical protein